MTSSPSWWSSLQPFLLHRQGKYLNMRYLSVTNLCMVEMFFKFLLQGRGKVRQMWHPKLVLILDIGYYYWAKSTLNRSVWFGTHISGEVLLLLAIFLACPPKNYKYKPASTSKDNPALQKQLTWCHPSWNLWKFHFLIFWQFINFILIYNHWKQTKIQMHWQTKRQTRRQSIGRN